MRFMMMVRSDRNIEEGAMPTERELAEMAEYNEELGRAGVLLAGEGLHPSSKGVRVTFTGGEPTVVNGPFPASELIGGFWIIQVNSRDEAVEWARRVPFTEGEIELRQIFEAEDFGEQFTPELREREQRLREQTKDPQQQ